MSLWSFDKTNGTYRTNATILLMRMRRRNAFVAGGKSDHASFRTHGILGNGLRRLTFGDVASPIGHFHAHVEFHADIGRHHPPIDSVVAEASRDRQPGTIGP